MRGARGVACIEEADEASRQERKRSGVGSGQDDLDFRRKSVCAEDHENKRHDLFHSVCEGRNLERVGARRYPREDSVSVEKAPKKTDTVEAIQLKFEDTC